MAATHERLALARSRLRSSQDFSRELAQRCRAVTADMLRLTDPSSAAQRAPNRANPPTPPNSTRATESASLPSAPAAPAPMHAPQAFDLRTQLQGGPRAAQTPAATHTGRSGGQPPRLPPPPPDPLPEWQPVCDSPLLPMMPQQRPLPPSAILAPLDPPTVFKHLSGPRLPLAGGPMLLSLQLFSAASSACSTSLTGGPAQALVAAGTLMRRLHGELHDQRAAAAAEAGVAPQRVAWFLQTPYTVPGGRPLAFSTALASPACLASQFAFLVTSCLESTFLSSALSRTSARAGQVVDVSGTSPGSGTLSDQPVSSATPPPPRSTADSTATRDTLARMTAVVHHYPSCSDRLRGSCGVGGHFAVATGVAEIVRAMCQRYRELLPRSVWIETCAAFAQLMLQQRSNRATTLPCSIHGIYGDSGAADDAVGSPRARADAEEAMDDVAMAGADSGEDTSSSGSCSQRSRAGAEAQSAAGASGARSADAAGSGAAAAVPQHGEKRERGDAEGAGDVERSMAEGSAHDDMHARVASSAGIAEMEVPRGSLGSGAEAWPSLARRRAPNPARAPLPRRTRQASPRAQQAQHAGTSADASQRPEAAAGSMAAPPPPAAHGTAQHAARLTSSEEPMRGMGPEQGEGEAQQEGGPERSGEQAEGGGRRPRGRTAKRRGRLSPRGALPPHDVATCPRCGVLACIADTMLQVMQEVFESPAITRTHTVQDGNGTADARAQHALDEAVAAGEVRARTQALYAAYAVFLSQCCTDAPHLTRHLNLNSSSSDPAVKSGDKMTVKLFQQLRLPPRQLQLAAAAAEYWRMGRRGLDMDLRLALAPLSRLPHLATLPRAEVLSLCGLQLPDPPAASEARASGAFGTAPALPADTAGGGAVRDIPPVAAPLPAGLWQSGAAAVAGEGGGGEGSDGVDRLTVLQSDGGLMWDTADLDAEMEEGVCMLCGRYGCSGSECRRCMCECTYGHAAVSWQQRLLGCDPAASAAARAALRRLRAFQQADSDLFADMQRAVRMPGCIFTAEQMVGGLPTALQHAVPFVDWLRVCQTAAGEARTEQLRADGRAMGWTIE
eukprot:jgi/Ulvmu1/1163/UM107_0037.1